MNISESQLDQYLSGHALLKSLKQAKNGLSSFLTIDPNAPVEEWQNLWVLVEGIQKQLVDSTNLLQSKLTEIPLIHTREKLSPLEMRINQATPQIRSWLQNLIPSKEMIGIHQGEWISLTEPLRVQFFISPQYAPSIARKRDLVLTSQLQHIRFQFWIDTPPSSIHLIDWTCNSSSTYSADESFLTTFSKQHPILNLLADSVTHCELLSQTSRKDALLTIPLN